MIKTLLPHLRPKERAVFKNGNRLDMRRSNLSVDAVDNPEPNSLERGAMAEAFVCFDLIRQGFHVFTPFQPYSPYDIIALGGDHRPLRIQVKHRRANNGRISLSLRTTHTNTKGTVQRPMNLSDFDVLAIFCPDTNAAYYVPTASIASLNVSLWIGDGTAARAPSSRLLPASEMTQLKLDSGRKSPESPSPSHRPATASLSNVRGNAAA